MSILNLSPALFWSADTYTGLTRSVFTSSRHCLLSGVHCCTKYWLFGTVPVHTPQSCGQVHLFSCPSHLRFPHSFGIGV